MYFDNKHTIMPLDRDKLLKQFEEMITNAKEPTTPDFLNDDRLEDAFLTPETDNEGYSPEIPAIWNDYGYGKYPDGVLFITLKSASIKSSLYSKYLDEEALVWDSIKERLLLYVPDPEEPRMAFKGSAWQFAKRLKPEYDEFMSLRDIYEEYLVIKGS